VTDAKPSRLILMVLNPLKVKSFSDEDVSFGSKNEEKKKKKNEVFMNTDDMFRPVTNLGSI